MSEIEDLRRSVENIEKKFLEVEERIKKMRERDKVNEDGLIDHSKCNCNRKP